MAQYVAAARQAASRMVSDTQIDPTTTSVTGALKKRRAAREKDRNVFFGNHIPIPPLNPDEVFLFMENGEEDQALLKDTFKEKEDDFEHVKREQLARLQDLREELEELDSHRTEEDIAREFDEDEDDHEMDSQERKLEIQHRLQERQERRRVIVKKILELEANLEAQGLIRNMMNPHAEGQLQEKPTTSVLTAVTSLVIDEKYEQVTRRKNLIMAGVAILQCFLVLCMLQIPWDDQLLVYDNNHPAIAVIEVMEAVLTAVMLYLIVDYYRHLAKWEAVQMNLPPECASLRRYSRFNFMIVELLVCVIHPFPYLYVRKLSLLVFFRLYILLRVYRDHSRIYRWRREIQSHDNVKAKIRFDAWLSFRSLFYRAPWSAILICTVVTVFFFAYCLYINEREVITPSELLKGYINAGCTVVCPPSGEYEFEEGTIVNCNPQETIIRDNCPSTGHFGEFRSCVYFVSLTMTTIGIGEQVALTNWGRVFLMIAALFGMAIAGILLSAILRVITLNYAQKFAADFCALKHLALQEQHLAARVIQQFFREGLKSGKLRRMALRNRAVLAQTRRGSLGMGSIASQTAAAAAAATAAANAANANGQAGTTSQAPKAVTMKQAAIDENEKAGCCSHSEFALRIEQFKRYRLSTAQQIGQEDGTQIKHVFAMRTFAGNTAMAVEDLQMKQTQMMNHVQRMGSALLSVLQAFTAKTVESMRRTGAARKTDVGNTELTLTQHALRGSFATSLANNRVSGLGLAPLPIEKSPKSATGELIKDESMGVFYVFS